MLVITRKKGESILIGDDIEIFISDVSNGNVKISISAPKSIKIIRKELISEIKEENKNSSSNIDILIKKMK